jgi:peptidyl-prolyl cis-trans isomerase A (cyclophilin A)
MEKYLKQPSHAAGLCLTVLFGALLSACGGSDSSTTATPTPATPSPITSVTTASTLMYGKSASFTVVGTGIERGLSVSSAGCSGVTLGTGGTSTQQTFTCTLTATGTVQLSLGVTGAGSFTSSQTVPVPQVTMNTSLGAMVIELYPNNAPLSVNNFLQYVTDGFYTNLIFHRVIGNFVVQGGGFDSALVEAVTRAAIPLESGNGLFNQRGTIAMARTNVLNSATSQFYLNVVDNPSLDATSAGANGFAVFGKVVTGLEVMDAIRVVPTGRASNGFTDVPLTPVVITGVIRTQ